MEGLKNFFLYKSPVFYLALVLFVLTLIQAYTAYKRSKRNFKIHRTAGWIMIVTILIHAFLGFSRYW